MKVLLHVTQVTGTSILLEPLPVAKAGSERLMGQELRNLQISSVVTKCLLLLKWESRIVDEQEKKAKW
jgi:hypothetical protein